MAAIVVEGASFELVLIPPGEFLMGSHNALFSEAPPHRVTIRNGFYLGKYPVTQAQWQAVMGNNPAAFSTADDRPVDSVSWEAANAFCSALAKQCGRHIRLPSEAEWEYACRAGTSGEFFFLEEGTFLDDSEIPWAVRQALAEYAWFDLNSTETTQPVGAKRANPWGIYDILGNVWEWCADSWHGSYAGAPEDGSPWTDNAGRQPRRCLRGGAWDMNAFRCRSTYRSFEWKELATNRFGLRIVADL